MKIPGHETRFSWRLIEPLVLFLCIDSCFAKQPNILLIVSEDNGPELGCYGDLYAKTPHLNRLATQGLCFLNAYVPQSGCSQSRASYLTGLYPHQHGQFGLATWGFRLYREDIPNLPVLLKQAGYRTGIIGKLHINPASAFPFDYKEIPNANFQRQEMHKYVEHAKTFINAADSPFFLSINYPDAHDPWIRQVDGIPASPLNADAVTPMPYMGLDGPALRELVADYYNCISRLDTYIGELLSALAQSGKARNTMVIYLGDHGADMLRGKRTCYESGLKIPLIVRWPGHITPGRPKDLISTIDLFPTILEAAGLTRPDNLPGKSLQPLFNNNRTLMHREYYCAEYHTHAAASNYFPQRSIRNQQYKLILSLLPGTIHPDYEDTIRKLHGDHLQRDSQHTLNIPALISQTTSRVRSAYERMRRPPEIQLYDLTNDPYEFIDLADSLAHQSIKRTLLLELEKWREDTSDPLLDPLSLKQLTAEVQSVTNRTIARKHDWQYPIYFFNNIEEDIPIPQLK